MTSARPGRKPFYVHIATLFILLFTLLGSALIALQFQQAAQQGLEHERQNFLQYREQLALALQLNERPARMSLSLLRSGQLAAMNSLDARLGYLPQQAEVLAVGPGGMIEGKEIVMQVKVADKVIYSKYAGTEVELEKETFIVVKQSDILAIIES